eukprot:SAG31_NODE_2001_length_6694_cov_7.781198_4_plen_275_part_00
MRSSDKSANVGPRIGKTQHRTVGYGNLATFKRKDDASPGPQPGPTATRKKELSPAGDIDASNVQLSASDNVNDTAALVRTALPASTAGHQLAKSLALNQFRLPATITSNDSTVKTGDDQSGASCSPVATVSTAGALAIAARAAIAQALGAAAASPKAELLSPLPPLSISAVPPVSDQDNLIGSASAPAPLVPPPTPLPISVSPVRPTPPATSTSPQLRSELAEMQQQLKQMMDIQMKQQVESAAAQVEIQTDQAARVAQRAAARVFTDLVVRCH